LNKRPSALRRIILTASVLTVRGAFNPAAQAYLDFRGSPAGGRILEQFGYRLP
jgi:hypothetical protein